VHVVAYIVPWLFVHGSRDVRIRLGVLKTPHSSSSGVFEFIEPNVLKLVPEEHLA